jgi:hypothetical protein
MSRTLIYAALAATTLGGFATSAEAAAFAGVDRRTLYVVGRGAVWKIRTLAGGPEGRGK